MEYDESAVQCCMREIREETGLDIRVGRLFWNYSGHDDPRSNALLAMYFAEITGGRLCAGDDAVEVMYFDINNTPTDIAFQAHIDAIADFRRYKQTGHFPGE